MNYAIQIFSRLGVKAGVVSEAAALKLLLELPTGTGVPYVWERILLEDCKEVDGVWVPK